MIYIVYEVDIVPKLQIVDALFILYISFLLHTLYMICLVYISDELLKRTHSAGPWGLSETRTIKGIDPSCINIRLLISMILHNLFVKTGKLTFI